MLPADLVIHAPRAIVAGREQAVDIAVADGQIVAITALGGLPDGAAAATLELSPAAVLLPGLVDSHVHINEPGHADWEGFSSATAAAAAGGFTSLVDMPLDCVPVTTTVAALEAKRQVAVGQCEVDVGFWAGVVPENAADYDELGALWEQGVLGFKCFLADSGLPEFRPLEPPALHEAMTNLTAMGASLLVHAESQRELDRQPAPDGRSYRAFLDSRPRIVEDAAVAEVIEAVRRTGCRTHIVHLSSASALPLLAAAQAEGLPITAETCPHYLTVSADQIADGATQFAACPPIREAANAEALWEALFAGVIDLVVSDHSPCAPELKQLDTGDFSLAWGGISSLQLGLPLLWTAAAARGAELAQVIRWLAEQPAELAGLSQKGSVRVGADADFVLFDPDAEFEVEPARLRHRHQVTPYAGRRLRGIVQQTWLRGRPVNLAEPRAPHGTLLRRSAPGGQR